MSDQSTGLILLYNVSLSLIKSLLLHIVYKTTDKHNLRYFSGEFKFQPNILKFFHNPSFLKVVNSLRKVMTSV